MTLFNRGFSNVLLKSATVLHLPHDKDQYQHGLINALKRRKIDVEFFPELSPSASINLLLLPLHMLILRIRGTRIIHVHWLFFYKLTMPNLYFLKRCLRWHLNLTLILGRACGLRFVWTAHNFLPHEPIFDDDVRARKILLKNASAVIAHNAYSVDLLSNLNVPFVYRIIPQGAYEQKIYCPRCLNAISAQYQSPDIGKMLEDSDFGANQRFIFLGTISAYKGILELLKSILAKGVEFSSPLRIDIIGKCNSPELEKQMEEVCQSLNLSGIDVRFQNIFLSEDDYEDILRRELIFLAPFAAITNSGSLVHVLSRQAKIITFDFPHFREFMGGNLVKVPMKTGSDRRDEGFLELTSRDDYLALADLIRRISIGEENPFSKDYVSIPSWDNHAEQYISLYQELIALRSIEKYL